jgi:homoserine kinase type II
MKVHTLTKKEANKISEIFRLGEVKSIKVFSSGLINSNYRLETKKGKFVIRIIGNSINEWKRNRMNLEERTLLFLAKKNFPYEVPIPLKNKYGRYLSRLNEKTYWVYKMLHGIPRKNSKITDFQLREIAKGMATYHKYIGKMKIPKKDLQDIFTLDWFVERYGIMKKRLDKIEKKNKVDSLVKNNFDEMHRLILKLSKINFLKKILVVHGDIHGDNLLFKNNRLKGFLDFDNLKVAPRAEDIAYFMRFSVVSASKGIDKRRMNLFLKEYEKQIKLSKIEKKMLIPLMIRGNVIVFWWMSEEMKKGLEKKYDRIRWTCKINKELVKAWERELK